MPKIAPVPIIMPRIAFNFDQLSNNSLIRFSSVSCSAAAFCNPLYAGNMTANVYGTKDGTITAALVYSRRVA